MPSAAAYRVAEPGEDRVVAGLPGSGDLPRDRIRVDDDRAALAEPARDRRLAAPDRAGQPDPHGPCGGHGARSSVSSQATSAASRATLTSASSEVTRRSSTKFAQDRRVGRRELEMVLAQPEPGELGLDRRLLAPVGVLRQPRPAAGAPRLLTAGQSAAETAETGLGATGVPTGSAIRDRPPCRRRASASAADAGVQPSAMAERQAR